MKVFAVVAAVLLVAYARGDVTQLTQAQVDALSADETKAITDEQWGILYSRWCNPAFQSYAKSQYLPDRRNCHYFYECVGFKPVRMECAGNLYWNAKLETCDYADHSGCWYNSASPINNQPALIPAQQPINDLLPPSDDGSNSNDGIDVPIENNPIVVDPYKV